ncbi:Ribosomal RNA large subunit methyltransferase K/L [Sinobacterium norvegicum]|uniref:Ribosomal RNA large subunit methyltransferase K/L n=1 Tax=Sinobacterium norvegicum TaxID=1641715 RepID=A0ABM9AHN7_9GAMM|nr:bifunctional 23S rRNA (guanine(2069)-N(7))-methyltransferase RlmK/23S rRNA (guanine(2445)-N(2))-methyltransferase RlmL [Sinobacterium norvegicum]CAH0992741.1 Ribosomal RNA large subunit methyltransferase K/L [Sinobacterium norvegicum]
MSESIEYFISCPRGLEELLRDEVLALGADKAATSGAGVKAEGDLAQLYRVWMWSRLASRIQLPLARVELTEVEALYNCARNIAWGQHFNANQSFAVDFSGTNRMINNSQFGALKIKDAIVDYFRDSYGVRPDVDKRDPEIRIQARMAKGYVSIALDISGGPLHRRGYRLQTGIAPMRENLAAAVLMRGGWPEIAKQGGALIDPMCGSGTLLIEGAMMAADIAPGLNRESCGLDKWRGHDADVWQQVVDDAQLRAAKGVAEGLPEIRGYDAAINMVQRAEQNIVSAGLAKHVRVSAKSVERLSQPTHMEITSGLVACNPPYGERIGEVTDLIPLYRQLGSRLKSEFEGWKSVVITSNPELGKRMGLKARKKYKVFNGPLEAQILCFDIIESNFVGDRNAEPAAGKAKHDTEADSTVVLSANALMFANRLKKNQKKLANWIKRENIECYRLYDADMPEYAVAVDIYGDKVQISEYKPPASIDENSAQRRLLDTIDATAQVLKINQSQINVKQRQRQKGKQQYERKEGSGEYFTVKEGQVELEINLTDYLDTGLFLDHRPVRQFIASQAKNKHFLNLFCYTGTASVHAAKGGALSTTSVDMSATYLDWAKRNFKYNNFTTGTGVRDNHHLIQQDCISWIKHSHESYDLILLDPPTFSNSKRMDGTLDIQRDQVSLVEDTMALLKPGGLLIFSNNYRGFKIDPILVEKYSVEDVSHKTLDPDFVRNKKIHQCFYLRAK